MEFIEFRTLLSEMRIVEQQYIETCACHLDEASQKQSRLARERLKVFDELIRYARPHVMFPNDYVCERILLRTIECIAEQRGFVQNDHFGHVPEELLRCNRQSP